jgi:hypothetical protein
MGKNEEFLSVKAQVANTSTDPLNPNGELIWNSKTGLITNINGTIIPHSGKTCTTFDSNFTSNGAFPTIKVKTSATEKGGTDVIAKTTNHITSLDYDYLYY